MKNYNLIFINARRVESKKSKPISTPSLDAGQKSHPIPAPRPLRGEKNPHEVKWVKRDGTKLSSPSIIIADVIYLKLYIIF